jgi:glycosyltransferase involved in cell wall biosynthesis
MNSSRAPFIPYSSKLNLIMSVLYISYDGMLEPLGEGQVLGYLEQLARTYDIHLISFEKPRDRNDPRRMTAMTERIAAAGIAWTPLTYHKNPSAPATAYDVAAGIAAALVVISRYGVRIVHSRSYVAALIALAVKRVTSVKFLFDMRGFWADERADAGIWPKEGRLYRISKSFERSFFRSADHVVTLTDAAAREIARFPYLEKCVPPITIIPTCADLDRFRPPASNFGSGVFTLGYAGAVGLGHSLDEALAFYTAVREQKAAARLLIVNRNEHDTVKEFLARNGIEPRYVDIVAAEYQHMPVHLRKMSAGLAIYKPSYSALGRAPTRVAEYLGCGVPCVGNIGIGDIEHVLEPERVGVALRGFSPNDHRESASRLLALLEDPRIRERCVSTARRLFSLRSGVEAYKSIYNRLAMGCDA